MNMVITGKADITEASAGTAAKLGVSSENSTFDKAKINGLCTAINSSAGGIRETIGTVVKINESTVCSSC
jgi:hypothetical protein